jgi:hypothetical protein
VLLIFTVCDVFYETLNEEKGEAELKCFGGVEGREQIF